MKTISGRTVFGKAAVVRQEGLREPRVKEAES